MQRNADGSIVPRPPAKTSAERQRAFRRRHPEYYKLLQRKRRAILKAMRAGMTARAARELVNGVNKEPLMLPAPVETIELPGITAIPQRDAVPFPELVELLR